MGVTNPEEVVGYVVRGVVVSKLYCFFLLPDSLIISTVTPNSYGEYRYAILSTLASTIIRINRKLYISCPR